MNNESAGLPNSCNEDLIFFLCGNNHSPEHEDKIKKMKLSKAGIKIVIKEKEAFRIWRDAKKNEAG